MTEMEERVARAIAETLINDTRPIERKAFAYLLQARAAIAAMRMPTDEMLKAWERLEPRWDNSTAPPTLSYPLCSGPGFAWELGVDAALNDAVQSGRGLG